jgi:hypothetical protein
VPYLKVEPDTYNLSKRQMFQFDTCQFCGSTDFNLRFFQNHSGKAESSRGSLRDVLARRSCMDCGKTTALVKSKL